MRILLLILGVLLSIHASAAPKRISSIIKDLGKVEKVYLYPGLISVIEFPHPLLEVRIGNPKALKVEISQVSSRELTLHLSGLAAKATNLIVRSNQKLYVFDIVPSRVSHQDFVQVKSFYGGPERSVSDGVLLERGRISPSSGIDRVVKGKLIESETLGGF
ncbi:hypothetical protein ACNH6C_13700 [Bdellovibrio bacteriovorus]|uniref:hypothetical protein n=1 Tax=Bdellovibrio bacteriovorus TaxID=959 RepID=UPI003A7FFC5B